MCTCQSGIPYTPCLSAPDHHNAISTDGQPVRVTFEAPRATDNIDTSVTVTSSHAFGSLFSVGTTNVIFTAADDSNNRTTHTMQVVVTHVPPTSSYAETFESGVSSWTMSGTRNWTPSSPHTASASHILGSRVLSSHNCTGTYCIANLDRPLDTSGPLTISFDRFIGRHIDTRDGLYLEYSSDGGFTWSALSECTGNAAKDTNRWESESVQFDITPNTALLRFVAQSTMSDAIIQIDNIRVSQGTVLSEGALGLT